MDTIDTTSDVMVSVIFIDVSLCTIVLARGVGRASR